jgi:hypothetical protein
MPGSFNHPIVHSDTGEITFVVNAFLAANAYLNAPGNFALLTDLVTRNGGQVWVDEYLHGYRDAEAALPQNWAAIIFWPTWPALP